MSKEYELQANINGNMHEILIEKVNTHYNIFDDGEYVGAVYQKLFNNPCGVIETVVIADKSCSFMIWNGLPDLEVDGCLLRAGCSFREGLSKHSAGLKVMGCSYAGFAVLWAGMSILSGVNVWKLVFAALCAFVAFLYLHGWKRTLETNRKDG